MEETKFTPGPWEACEPGDYTDFDGNSRVILGNIDDVPTRVGVLHWSDIYRTDSDANAALIAAAPDLYAALEAAAWFVRNFPQSHIPENHGFVLPIEHVDAVLRKARGE